MHNSIKYDINHNQNNTQNKRLGLITELNYILNIIFTTVINIYFLQLAPFFLVSCLCKLIVYVFYQREINDFIIIIKIRTLMIKSKVNIFLVKV